MGASDVWRLFLDHRVVAERRNVERVLGLCAKHERNPLLLDGQTVWTANNLAVSVYRDEATGEFRGWRGANTPVMDENGEEHWNSVAFPIRSADGLVWETVGDAWPFVSVIRDDHDPDDSRRYKAIAQGKAILDEDGNVTVSDMDEEAFAEAVARGEKVSRGMFVCCSPDGVT